MKKKNTLYFVKKNTFSKYYISVLFVLPTYKDDDKDGNLKRPRLQQEEAL